MSNEVFESLCTNFLFLNCEDEKSKGPELNSLLNQLNDACHSTKSKIPHSTATRLIESLLRIPRNEDVLIVKACCLVESLHKIHNVVVEESLTIRIINWLLECCEKKLYAIICDVLETFKILITGVQDKSKLPLDYLIGNQGLFIQLIDKSKGKAALKNVEEYRNEEIVVSIILCLNTLIDDSSSSNIPVEYLNNVGEALLTLMYSASAKDYGEVEFCTLTSTCLDIQRKIAEVSKDFAEKHIGELLGLTKAFMVRGLPINQNEAIPKPLIMSQQSLFEPSDLIIKKGGKTVKKRKHRNNKSSNAKRVLDDDPTNYEQSGAASIYNASRINWDSVPFVGVISASDFSQSDTEGGAGSGAARHEQRSKQSHLRLACLLLLERLCKTVDKKNMFGYWHNFFPQEYSPESSQPLPMLPYLLLMDPNPKCRCMVAQTISTFVRFSKFFLYQAESDNRTTTSFTAFSVSLGQSIIATYRILTRALSAESHVAVIIQILKSFSSLIQSTPFHKLESGMVSNLIRYVRKLVHHKDLDVKVSSLVIVGFLLSVPEKTLEIREQLGLAKVIPARKTADEAEDENEEAEEEVEIEQDGSELNVGEPQPDKQETPPDPIIKSEMSWILRVVLDLLGVKLLDLKVAGLKVSPPTPLKVECLHILSAMTSHPELLRNNLHHFTDAIKVALEDPSPECHLFAVRVIDYTGYALSHNARGLGPGLEECIEFWFTVVPLISDQLQRPASIKYAIKPICCDALSNIGAAIYEKLPQNTRGFLISLLQGCFYADSSEEDGNLLKASAGRALAVFALFPSLRDDLVFIETTSEMIVSLFQDRNALVRKKCTWSLGNILEALVEMQGVSAFGEGNRIQDHYLERFFLASLQTDDQEKVRCNIMRCLGNLVRLLTAQHMREVKWRKLAMQSVEAVVDNAINFKAVKVKWNACYSLGLMMRNEEMFAYAGDSDLDWPGLVYPTLCKLMVANPNFKVRTTAVIAVAVPKERRQYGGHFEEIWDALIRALEQAGNLIDFNEYKHRDNLMDQLCTSMSHFIMISGEKDLVAMKGPVTSLFDVTKQNWFRVINRILPEQGSVLISAANKLKDLVSNNAGKLAPEVRDAATLMASCFAPPLEYL